MLIQYNLLGKREASKWNVVCQLRQVYILIITVNVCIRYTKRLTFQRVMKTVEQYNFTLSKLFGKNENVLFWFVLLVIAESCRRCLRAHVISFNAMKQCAFYSGMQCNLNNWMLIKICVMEPIWLFTCVFKFLVCNHVTQYILQRCTLTVCRKKWKKCGCWYAGNTFKAHFNCRHV